MLGVDLLDFNGQQYMVVVDYYSRYNGPQFSSKEFRQFADLLGFTHQTSSPYYPQANGPSEPFRSPKQFCDNPILC